MFLSAKEVNGNVVNLLSTRPQHLDGIRNVPEPEKNPEKSFRDLLISAFSDVNDQQILSQELEQLMITDPGAVNVHDVTITVAEASMALSMTKAVVDGAIQAYKEIINTR